MVDVGLHHLSEAVRIRPDEFVAHFNIAVLRHLRTTTYDEAYRHYIQALTIDVANADAHYYFAHLCFMHYGQAELARQHVKEALLIDPDHVEARLLLGIICEEIDFDFHAAAHYYHEAVQLNSMVPEGHVHLGRLYCRAGFSSVAVEQFAQALLQQPACLQAKNNIAAAFVTNAPDQALNYLDRALQLCPQSPIVHFNLGVVYRKIADSRPQESGTDSRDEVRSARLVLALEHFARAAELNDNDGEAVACMAEIRMKLDPKDMTEVERLYATAINMSPNIVGTTHGLALILYSQGRYHEALELCSAACQTCVDNPRPYRSLARILIEVFDRADEAIPYLVHALQLEPMHFETQVQLIMHYVDRNLRTAQRYAQKLFHAYPTDDRAERLWQLVTKLIRLSRTETTI
jgi:tetratricopeptide (TPR) repeat protein